MSRKYVTPSLFSHVISQINYSDYYCRFTLIAGMLLYVEFWCISLWSFVLQFATSVQQHYLGLCPSWCSCGPWSYTGNPPILTNLITVLLAIKLYTCLNYLQEEVNSHPCYQFIKLDRPWANFTCSSWRTNLKELYKGHIYNEYNIRRKSRVTHFGIVSWMGFTGSQAAVVCLGKGLFIAQYKADLCAYQFRKI